MSGRFSGRTAVVTGGAGGIGAATARRLGADGAAVAIVDRDEALVEQTVEVLKSGRQHCRGRCLRCDLK